MSSTRNPVVGDIHRSVDNFVNASFRELFQRMKDEGRIAPLLDIPTLANVFMVMGDGMFWRRAIDTDFDVESTMPAIVALVRQMLNPIEPASTQPGTLTRVLREARS